MGRTFDYEFSYGEEIVVTPRKYVFDFRHTDKLTTHYAMIGMAFVADGYPLYYDAVNEKGLGMAGLNFEMCIRDRLSLLAASSRLLLSFTCSNCCFS